MQFQGESNLIRSTTGGRPWLWSKSLWVLIIHLKRDTWMCILKNRLHPLFRAFISNHVLVRPKSKEAFVRTKHSQTQNRLFQHLVASSLSEGTVMRGKKQLQWFSTAKKCSIRLGFDGIWLRSTILGAIICFIYGVAFQTALFNCNIMVVIILP